MDYIEIGYLGFSYQCISMLLRNKSIHLKVIILPKKRITSQIEIIGEMHKIPVVLLEDINQLERCMEENHQLMYIMYEFDWIVSKTILEKVKIINIHAGSLKMNRGANPIIWSILLGEKETVLSLYEISSVVDTGILIAEYPVKIDKDNSVTLKDKLELGIPFLIQRFIDYCKSRQGIMITDGDYRRKIQPKDYTIDIERDTIVKMQRKINSQKSYEGAILIYNGSEYFVTDCKKIKSDNAHLLDKEYNLVVVNKLGMLGFKCTLR